MYGFKKTNRLLKKLDYKQTFDEGVKVVANNLVIVGRQNQDCSRMGLIVSKKVGNAVVRNRIKRYLREAYRLMLPEISESDRMDVVVIARYTSKETSSHEISQNLSNGLKRLSRKLKKSQK